MASNSPLSIRHALNAVTTSYSLQWFDWARWERMIDWLALNGINAPLMPVGHEFVQREMLKKFNMTDNDWLPGPAFLSWARMGNLKKWAGPPSDEWLEDQRQLAVKILKRMKSDLDMDPILPAFAGFVPDSFLEIYPNDTEHMKLSEWAGFNCSYACILWIEPTNPLFKLFQAEYIGQQELLLGFKSTRFALDMFNEVTPKSNDPSFLAKNSKSVYESLPPGATWVLQGWMFLDKKFW